VGKIHIFIFPVELITQTSEEIKEEKTKQKTNKQTNKQNQKYILKARL